MKELLQLLLALFLIAFFLAVYVGIGVWAIRDARKRRPDQSGFLLVALFLLLGPCAVIFWLFVRNAMPPIARPHADYNTAEDALSAASRLDQFGEWDKAIALYENAALRWPEHREYIAECQKRLQAKQTLG
ncbi:MAG: hypothetical protein IAF94_04360 [Pirellulaceae bacterium]|nr:hypothetical protein [Pirellulaceae bacterium]